MSNNQPVNPAEIPVFTGDVEVLEAKVKALRGHGVKVATAAGDVHGTFGGLRAFYQAPEADQLFSTTKPVVEKSLQLSSEMSVIAGALGTYADDIRPLVEELKSLKAEAAAFRSRVSGDDEWREDGDLVDENNERRDRIAEVWAQFQEAERSCHAKIVGLVGGPALKVSDGSGNPGMYGYDAEYLKQAGSLPWGDVVDESIPGWQVWEHTWEFGKGFVVDGVWGTITGIGTLVGFQGWDAAGEAWSGLAALGTGLGLSMTPVARNYLWETPPEQLPPELRKARTAVKETGKALLAWDKWETNPSRAAGEVSFNVLTTVFSGGAGGAAAGAGKAGAISKALSTAGKVGGAIDPTTYLIKGAGAGVTKVGDVMTGLKELGRIEVPEIRVDSAVALPEGSTVLPDGTVHFPSGTPIPEGARRLPNGTFELPEGTVAFPPGTVKLPVDGPARFMDPAGHIYSADGTLIQRAEDAPGGKPTAGADSPRVDAPATARVPERELAGVGARGGDDGTRLGSDTSDPLGPSDDTSTPRPDTTPGGSAPDNMPSNSAGTPSSATGSPSPEPPSTGGRDEPLHPTGHADEAVTDHRSVTGHGSDHGAPSGGAEPVPERPPGGHESEGLADFQPMERGGELEQAVRDAVGEMPGRTRPKPNVLDRALDNLAQNPRGRQVAEIIASGRFNQSENFSQVVSSLGAKKLQMIEPGIDQIVFADALARSGFSGDRIAFEVKTPQGGDVDVRLVGDDGSVFGYQMKRLDNPLDPVSEITRGKYLGQLTLSEADHRIMLVDGQGTVAQWRDSGSVEKLMEIHQNGRGGWQAGLGVTFVVRLDDGTLVVPPGAKTDPKGML
ncbi:hypothetical protein AB0N23_06370 [Streptomyces sp. NPDC052644]